VKERRDAWHQQVSGIGAEQFIFIDESGARTNMTRERARGPRGQRVVADTPHGHWKTTTMISGVRLDGACASMVLDGATDADAFRAYVQHVLVPELRRGDVVVMDNLQPHKSAGVREMIESAGASVLYLPPYSPDFNPIENMWSKVKQFLKSVAARTFDELCDAIAEALRRVTRDDCVGFFNHCGYAAT
jgi:transposase